MCTSKVMTGESAFAPMRADSSSAPRSPADIEALRAEFDTDFNAGLASSSVAELRQRYGKNELAKEKRTPLWKLFLSQFTSIVRSGAAPACSVFRAWLALRPLTHPSLCAVACVYSLCIWSAGDRAVRVEYHCDVARRVRRGSRHPQ